MKRRWHYPADRYDLIRWIKARPACRTVSLICTPETDTLSIVTEKQHPGYEMRRLCCVMRIGELHRSDRGWRWEIAQAFRHVRRILRTPKQGQQATATKHTTP